MSAINYRELKQSIINNRPFSNYTLCKDKKCKNRSSESSSSYSSESCNETLTYDNFTCDKTINSNYNNSCYSTDSEFSDSTKNVSHLNDSNGSVFSDLDPSESKTCHQHKCHKTGPRIEDRWCHQSSKCKKSKKSDKSGKSKKSKKCKQTCSSSSSSSKKCTKKNVVHKFHVKMGNCDVKKTVLYNHKITVDVTDNVHETINCHHKTHRNKYSKIKKDICGDKCTAKPCDNDSISVASDVPTEICEKEKRHRKKRNHKNNKNNKNHKHH